MSEEYTPINVDMSLTSDEVLMELLADLQWAFDNADEDSPQEERLRAAGHAVASIAFDRCLLYPPKRKDAADD